MGISLKDFGNFAVGAIEQDKVNTKERFAIRNEELQANRASLIKRKDARYAKDIAAYDAEKKKYDTLKSAASNLKDGTINPRTYAAQYLITTLEDNFTKLSDDEQEKMITKLAKSGKTSDFTLKGNADEIEKKYAMQEANINKVTAKALEDARGDSFLIKQIIGENNSAKKDLATQVETALKANENVLTTKSISGEDRSLVGIPLTGKDGGDSDSIIGNFSTTKLADYNKFRDKLFNVVKDYKYIDKDVQGTVTWAATTKALGTDTKAFITYENNIPKSWTTSGASVGASMQNTVNDLVQSKTNMNNYALKLYLQNPDYSNLASRVSKQELLTEARTIIRDRGAVTKLNSEKVWSMLPTSIVNGDNKFTVNGKTYTLSNQEMLSGKFTTAIVNGQEVRTKTENSAKEIYNNIVKSYVKGELKIDGSGFYKGQDEVQRAYQLIQDGLTEGTISTSGLSKYIKEQLVGKYNLVAVGEEAPTTKVDTNDKSKIKKTDNVEAPKIEKWVIGKNDNGEKGLRLDGTKEFMTFKKMNKEDIKGLSIDEKKEYDKWEKEVYKNTEMMKDVQAPIKGGLNSADFQSKHKIFKETYLKSIGR